MRQSRTSWKWLKCRCFKPGLRETTTERSHWSWKLNCFRRVRWVCECNNCIWRSAQSAHVEEEGNMQSTRGAQWMPCFSFYMDIDVHSNLLCPPVLIPTWSLKGKGECWQRKTNVVQGLWSIADSIQGTQGTEEVSAWGAGICNCINCVVVV